MTGQRFAIMSVSHGHLSKTFLFRLPRAAAAAAKVSPLRTKKKKNSHGNYRTDMYDINPTRKLSTYGMVSLRRHTHCYLHQNNIKFCIYFTEIFMLFAYGMNIFDNPCYTRVMRRGGMTTSDLGTRAWQRPCLHTYMPTCLRLLRIYISTTGQPHITPDLVMMCPV